MEPPAPVDPSLEDRVRRARFDPHELAVVLSHYDLGDIEQIRVYSRGSRRAPKARITTGRGDFLLKRRAPGRDDPYRVAFAHSLLLYLQERGYPVPALIGTRQGNNSMLQVDGRMYELFEFAPGTRYGGSARATERAGGALGALHRLLGEFQPPYEPPVATYHAAAGMEAKLNRIPDAVLAREPQADRKALFRAVEVLGNVYARAVGSVNETGFRSWPKGIIHGDWHPGNLLYGGRKVVAVLDFDSARLEPRVADVANAALQFSMKMVASDNLDQWPEGLDVDRIRGLVRGYDRAAPRPLTAGELRAVPWLMIEALIVESVLPIAATGSFGRISGSGFLQVVERKVHWIAPRSAQLVRFLEEHRGRG